MQKRIPKLSRVPELLKSTTLTQRSFEVLEVLAHFRLLSTSQITELVVGNTKVTHRHLQKLYHLGLIERVPLMKNGIASEFAYVLRRAALKLLATQQCSPIDKWGIDRQTSFHGYHNSPTPGRMLFLEHELMISRFHLLLHSACAKSGGRILLKSWLRGPETWSKVVVEDKEQERTLPHRPDAVFALEQTDAKQGERTSHYFYEADRGTASAGKMIDKLKAHLAFLLSGQARTKFQFTRVRAVLIEVQDVPRAQQVVRWAKLVCPNQPVFWIAVSSLLSSTPRGTPSVFAHVWSTVDRAELSALI